MVACLLLVSGCGSRVAEEEHAEPAVEVSPVSDFDPATTAAGVPSSGSPSATPMSSTTLFASPRPRERGPIATSASTGAPTPATATSQPSGGPARSSVTDPCGDLVDGVGEQPGWSDVAEVVVTHDRRVLEVAIRLCDVPVPDANRQLNLLHVHDTDGDGQADREVWATLTHQGWHTSRFVATDGRAIPVPAGGIEIEQDADVVRIVVPRSMVDPLPTEWAVGAESGTAADFAVQQTWRDTAPNSPGVVKHPADG